MSEINPRLAIWLQRFHCWYKATPLGPLEYRVLATLWTHGPLTVLEMRPYFPRAAYTTLMTTLDRLYKKGLLIRVRRGRCYVYRPIMSRDELHAAVARHLLRGLEIAAYDRRT